MRITLGQHRGGGVGVQCPSITTTSSSPATRRVDATTAGKSNNLILTSTPTPF